MDNEKKVIDEILPVGFLKGEDNNRIVLILRLKCRQDKQFALISLDWIHRNYLKDKTYISLLRLETPNEIQCYRARHLQSFFEYIIPGYTEEGEANYLFFTKRTLPFEGHADNLFLNDEDFTKDELSLFLENTISFLNDKNLLKKTETEHKEVINFFLKNSEISSELFPFESFFSIKVDKKIRERL